MLLTVSVVVWSSPAVAQLPAAVTTQELLPGTGVTGVVRTNEPVSVGLPLADSAGITSTAQLGCSGPSSVCQFRQLATWPDGNIKWVQFDYLSSLAANGTDTNAPESLVNGTGNVGSEMATDSNDCAGANAGFICVNTGTGGGAFAIRKANFDVIHSAVVNSVGLVGTSSTCGGPAGTSGCLALMAGTFGSTPIATCTFNSNCTMLYSSANDPNSTCTIEEHGSVRVAVKCVGRLLDSSGNRYMGFLARLHFFKGNKRVKIVVTLKNADDGASGSFAISHKGYQAFEVRLATALSGTNNWAIGNETATPTSGNFSSGTQAYIYQGFAQNYLDNGYCGAGVPDAVSDIPRVGATSGNCTYGQVGYLIVKSDATTVSNGALVTPAGWADVRDATGGQGIEFGVEHMAATFPRSLQIVNSGQEIRIGISPDQALWTTACPAAVPTCQKIYYQAWPEYKVSDIDLIFHDSDTNGYSESGATREASDFFRAQSYLIARATPAYYNSTQAFTYSIIDGNTEDTYWHGVNASKFPLTSNAIPDATYNVNSPCNDLQDVNPACLYFKRKYPRAQGGDPNQLNTRYADLISRWIGRGQTGRYLKVKWWERSEEMQGWPRAEQAGDGPNCPSSGPLAGRARWACHSPVSDLDSNDGYPTKCEGGSGSFTICGNSGGLLPNNSILAYVDFVGVNENFWSHAHWWELIYYYYMTGDEDANDLLKDGVITEFTAIPGVGNRTTYSGTSLPWNGAPPTWQGTAQQGSGAAAFNALGASRAISSHLNGATRFWQYLTETGGLSADISAVRSVASSNLNLALSESCATDARGNVYPSGCTPRTGTQATSGGTVANSPQVRGMSMYRGHTNGPNAFANEGGRDQVTAADIWSANCNTANNSQCSRRKAHFFEGLSLDSLWTYTHIFPPTDPSYQQVWDAAYGIALNTDGEMYRYGVTAGTSFPSPDQLLYVFSEDAPNDVRYNCGGGPCNSAIPGSTENRDNQIAAPWMNIYLVLGAYTGKPGVSCSTDKTNWRCHFDSNFQNKGAGYGSTDYGSYQSAAVIYQTLNPVALALQTVGAHAASGSDSGALTTTYSAGSVGGCSSSCWTLSWTAPTGVQQYLLKEHNTKTIVENIGWNPTTGNPIGDAVNTRNWWAQGTDQPVYVPSQPSLGSTSLVISAPSTASFMLKALTGGGGSGGGTGGGGGTGSGGTGSGGTGSGGTGGGGGAPGIGAYSALVDASTTFSTQLDGLSTVFACPDCYFRSPADFMLGQTVEVRLRSGTTSPTADEVALKQGTIDGQVTSVQASSFVFVPFSPLFGGQSLTVLTGSTTVFEKLSSPSVGDKVAVRGLLLRSTPGGPIVVARQVALIQ